MSTPIDPDRLVVPVSSRDHFQGNPSAKITLVQYGDYQCPRCYAAHCILPTIQQLLDKQIRFVFRHFPQPHIHPEAYHAAEAAEAAASQDKFWEMHTHLLQNQSNLSDSSLVRYAIALYLDVNQFLYEMTTDDHVARIQTDIDSGLQSGVVKTPTFFINGYKYSDDYGIDGLLEAVLKVNQL